MLFNFKKGNILPRRGAKCSEYACPSTLTKQGKWKELKRLLRSAKHADGKNPKFSCKCEQCAGPENLLHLACQYNSPEYIIDKLVKICPKYASELDHKHCLPLHIAIENDGTYGIVKSLLRKNEQGASAHDENGRAPLLSYFYGRACRAVKLTTKKDSFEIRNVHEYCQDIKIIALIRSISFFSILNIDNDNKGVLEYAMSADVHKFVLINLKQWKISASLKQWKISSSRNTLKTLRSFATISTSSESMSSSSDESYK